ncbi:FadR/GntR family transcriptional regulator [Rhodoligotrophos defluvii]|uniref:FadR/GntR family transcriptional regulator n=1 Tax=Rhodoligotrophos defluvii TaxID=2561934 RepID=UPI0010C94E90|nr:FCD domain-containing protein [Rhodoligotrophos defluvii]
MSLLQRRKPFQKLKLSDQILADLHQWIARENLQPGDRLPNEKQLMQHYGCAKGTIREALKALEIQGFIKMQTGPNGGAEIQPVSLDRVLEQLRAFVHFQTITFQHIYDLRADLEVRLADNVVGRISEEQFGRLQANIEECDKLQKSGDYAMGRRVEIGFHDILTEACDNPILTVTCRFLNDLLRDLVSMRTNNYAEHRNFGQHNIDSHRTLLKLLRDGDRQKVLAAMKEHMCEVEAYMRRADDQLGSQPRRLRRG